MDETGRAHLSPGKERREAAHVWKLPPLPAATIFILLRGLKVAETTVPFAGGPNQVIQELPHTLFVFFFLNSSTNKRCLQNGDLFPRKRALQGGA